MDTSNELCPHCGVENLVDATFCSSCGKAVSIPGQAGPRIINEQLLPTSPAGRNILTAELGKQMNKAAGALLAIAILQTLLGLVMLWGSKIKMENAAPGHVIEIKPMAYVVVFGVAVLFWGLYIWSRRNPLPAAIAGLVIYITLQLLDALVDPTMLLRGWLIKLILLGVFVKAISAGSKYRKLVRDQAATNSSRSY